MNPNEGQQRRQFQAFIPSRLIPAHKEFCPIVSVQAIEQEDGTFLDVTTETTFNESDIIRNPGFLLIHIGSEREEHTLISAADAIFYSVTSLFSACDIPVTHEIFRTTVEFSEYMKVYRSRYSHMILFGHGAEDGLRFLNQPNPIGGHEIAGFLGADMHVTPLSIISLCCHSGCKKLASNLSKATNVTEVIAPPGAFDLRWSTHFVTGLLLEIFIEGKSVDEAVTVAAQNSSNISMGIWRNGKLINC